MNHMHEGFRNLRNVDDALACFLRSARKHHVETERVPVSRALERVLADDVLAEFDVPRSDRSIVDGFAVKSTDVEGASEVNPHVLRITGESRLGEACRGDVRLGCAFAIATGSIVPEGADCVIPVEDVRKLSGRRIAVTNPVKRGFNILRKGEDVKRGKLVLRKAHRLRAQDLGVLKVLGLKNVHVIRRPRVAILSTGNELVETARSKSSSKIVDVNRLNLSAKIMQLGGTVIDFGIVKDQEELIKRALASALKSSDMVLVSGGSSVGQRDLVPSCINAVGKPGMLVHGVAMRPAMPTGLASVNGVPVISIPGFPVSAMFAFLIFGSPMLAKLSGAKATPEAKLQAKTLQVIKGVKGFRTFVRVVLNKTEAGFTVRPIGSQRASVMMSIVGADGFVVVPERAGVISRRRLVDVTLFR